MKKVIHLLFLFFTAKCLLAQPTITSVSPTSGEVGTVVTITGTNFSTTPSDNTVYIGGVRAQVTAATAEALTVIVPASASHQPITVTTSNLTAYSTIRFIITFPGGGVITNTTLGPAVFFPVPSSPGCIAHGDLDGDGKPDLVASSSGKIYLFRNTGTPGNISFDDKIEMVAPVTGENISIVDMDGDGKLDMLTVTISSSRSTVSVFRNTGTIGSFSFMHHHYPVDGFFNACTVNDIDGDGKADIAMVGSSAGTSILRNTSTPGIISFAAEIFKVIEDGSTRDIVLEDLDGDGKPEIISNIHFSFRKGSSVVVHRNLSTPGVMSFSTVSFPTGAQFDLGHIAPADWNADGKIDLAVTIYNLNVFANDDVRVFVNTSTLGNPNLVGNSYRCESYPRDLSAGDFDGDGKPDIVNVGNGITLRKNMTPNGPGIPYPGMSFFLPGIAFSSIEGEPAGVISPVDFDGDGKIDVAATQTDYVAVLRNQTGEPGILSFSPQAAGSGETITLTGGNFTKATGVTFGGVAAASFLIVSDTIITAIVGTGASGSVSVSSPSATSSKTGFTFIPTIVSIGDEYVSDADSFEVFPNPVNGRKVNILFNSALTTKERRLEVTDLTGKVIWSTLVIDTEQITWEGYDLPGRGVYLIALWQRGKKIVKKIAVTE